MKTINQPSGLSQLNCLLLAVLVGCVAFPSISAAQQGYAQPGYYSQQNNSSRWNQFYQKGDEISDRVSGFMRRIFSPLPAQQRNTYSATAAQPQTPTYYQQPAPAAAPSSGVHGYNNQPNSSTVSRPVQPATRKTSTPQRSSIFTKKPKVKTEPTPAPEPKKTYQPPVIDDAPPPAPQPEFKYQSPVQSKSESKSAPKTSPDLAPGTVVDTSGKPSSSSGTALGSIITDTPKSTPKNTSPQGDSIPMGKKGSLPNSVYSPYPPYNELDITGMGSGSTVKDPTTGKAFRVP